MPIEDLVDETLPKNERIHGVDHAEKARAVLHIRALKEAADSSRRSAFWSAVAGLLVALATIGLLITEVLRSQ